WDNGILDDLSFVPSSSDTYTVTGVDANGCEATDQITVTVNPLPAVSANASQTTVCDGEAVTLSGSGAVSYSWDNGVLDAVSFIPSASNSYTVTGVDANGCEATDQVNVTVNELPLVTLPSLGDYCIQAAEFELNQGSPAGGVYSGPGVASNLFSPSIAGLGVHIIEYSYTDANNCSNTASNSIEVNDCAFLAED